MIGACSFLRRKPQHTDAAFYSHWLNVHGPLAAQLHGVKRYLQSHFIVDSPRTNELARDLDVNGLAEMWFETEADREICYASEQEKVCDVDSLLFIGASARVVTDVTSVVLPPHRPAAAKALFVFTDGGRRDLGAAFKAISALPGITGLTDHRVTKAGAAPTQDRDAVSITASRMVAIAASDPGALDHASDILLADAGDAVAVFDCSEFYLV
jgi:uncharacterized protein (TIGR02118 family)